MNNVVINYINKNKLNQKNQKMIKKLTLSEIESIYFQLTICFYPNILDETVKKSELMVLSYIILYGDSTLAKKKYLENKVSLNQGVWHNNILKLSKLGFVVRVKNKKGKVLAHPSILKFINKDFSNKDITIKLEPKIIE